MNRLPDTPVVDFADTAPRPDGVRRRSTVGPVLGVLAIVIAIVLAVIMF